MASETCSEVMFSSPARSARVRDMINNDADAHVTANIVNDGSATNPYRLVLSAKTAGHENTIELLKSRNPVMDIIKNQRANDHITLGVR